jgi:uncharacterized protein YndB with AHSA1/START domain
LHINERVTMTSTDSTTDPALDRIERSIDIDATAERVWSLVQRPGWWINDEEVDPDPELREEDDGLTVLVHPVHGEFRLRTLTSEPPRYVSFHWVDNVAPEAGTTVEFWIEDRPGGVTLRVVESGFSRLRKDRAAIDHQIEENSHGWVVELEAARRFVQGQAG